MIKKQYVTSHDLAFLNGGGEVADAIKNYDWSASSLKDISGWPQNLKILLSVMFHSDCVMALLWSKEHIFFYNNACMKALNIDAQANTGKGIKEVLPGFWPLLQPALKQVIKKHKTVQVEELSVLSQQKGRKSWSFCYSPVPGENGELMAIIGIGTDITAHTEVRQKTEDAVNTRISELTESNKNLSRSNSELKQFAYTTSHDLQEPLRKVNIYTNLLEGSLHELSERSKGYLDKIKKASSKMLRLIKDILEYSELSKTRHEHVRVNLKEVVEDIIQDYELLIEQKKAIIHTEGLPLIEAVPAHMSQLFGNLISNALKYSRDGVSPEIIITASVLPEKYAEEYPGLNSKVKYYNIEIKDNGIGFDQEYAEQIFSAFQRLHDKAEYDGTGIGLSMCRKIVQNHGGDIYAKGRPGEGSTFVIILPEKQLLKN